MNETQIYESFRTQSIIVLLSFPYRHGTFQLILCVCELLNKRHYICTNEEEQEDKETDKTSFRLFQELQLVKCVGHRKRIWN
jgi:hypothetical protein